ncbi:MAG: hypothetical protein HOM25_14260 [Rhodospirillaceae bacterium]|nr:hypothetical protein [Rhodospirillaceae bacterium]MBT5665373.1 hypothetical protein [Rhodospirillaceae bacterium]MBT5811502.1 hypothetical protein [Rhodospirillaceae bacterium]
MTLVSYSRAFLLLAAMTVAVPAHAQDAPKVGDRLGDWVFNCRALSATQTICGVSQGLSDTKTKNQIMQLTVQKSATGANPSLFVVLPQGVYLGENVQGKINDKTSLKFIWQKCSKNGCQASAALDKDTVSAMKKGQKLEIGFKVTADGKVIKINASLKGIAKGFAALDIK